MFVGKVMLFVAIILLLNLFQLNFLEKQDSKTKTAIKLTQAFAIFVLAVVGITLVVNSYVYLNFY